MQRSRFLADPDKCWRSLHGLSERILRTRSGGYGNEPTADGVGFEPTVEQALRRFSRPVPSTAQPPIRIVGRPE